MCSNKRVCCISIVTSNNIFFYYDFFFFLHYVHFFKLILIPGKLGKRFCIGAKSNCETEIISGFVKRRKEKVWLTCSSSFLYICF